jgi:flagellin-like hook-associated protein FlgL
MTLTLSNVVSTNKLIRNTAKASNQISKISERLSTGFRINSAADDPAGLSLTYSLETNKKVYTRSLQNINNGVSYLSVQQDSLEEMQNIVLRIQELALQASNESITALQRTSLDTEAQQLQTEFRRIAENTSFNGIRVVQNSAESLTIQSGDPAAFSRLTVTAADVFGEGNLTFGAPISTSVPFGNGNYTGITVNDLNSDGLEDMVLSNISGSNSDVISYVSNGDGTFKFAQRLLQGGETTLQNQMLYDLNNDGNLDFIRSSRLDIRVSLGNGDGTFKARASYQHPVNGILPIEIGDLNEDGIPDIILGDHRIFIGNSDGSFKANVFADQGFLNGYDKINLIDSNSDGFLDVLGSDTNGTLLVNFGNGDGTFKYRSQLLAAPGGVSGSYTNTADLNEDGFTDFIINYVNLGYARVGLNQGNGTFSLGATVAIPGNPSAMRIADVNNDSNLDLIVNNDNSTFFSVVLGNGDGTFKNAITQTVPGNFRSINVIDYNGDGLKDFVAGAPTASDHVTLFQNTTDANILPDISLLTQSEAQKALTVTNNAYTILNNSLSRSGSEMKRLEYAKSAIGVTRDNLSTALATIKDADIAEDISTQIANKIKLSTAQKAFTQIQNLNKNVVKQLIRSI